MTSEAVVRSALLLIADHVADPALNALWISETLAISPEELDAAFSAHRPLSCDMSILNHRLSRLFERITAEPHTALEQQVIACGLASIEAADHHFRACFGIDLNAFHAVSLRAADDRQFRRSHPQRRSLIINE
jgi:methylphosphotriester-DNA--protein-cysteine methyltransferase